MTERLKIISRGEGPELVLLHGWAMHSGIWGGLVDHLTSEFRVNLVDLPGHGVNSDVPLSGDLKEVTGLITSQLPPAIWMGWSLGGLVTMAATLQQPQKVQGAIMITATPSFSKHKDWEFGVSPAQRRAFAEGIERDFKGAFDQFCLQCFGASHVDDAMGRLGYSAGDDMVPSQKVLQTGLHLLYSNNLLAGLETCKVPTLFIGGTRDRTIRPESLEHAAAMMPAGSSTSIRAAGHAPFISHQDKFLKIIREFIHREITG